MVLRSHPSRARCPDCNRLMAVYKLERGLHRCKALEQCPSELVAGAPGPLAEYSCDLAKGHSGPHVSYESGNTGKRKTPYGIVWPMTPPASAGPVDLIAWNDQERLFIQVKRARVQGAVYDAKSRALAEFRRAPWVEGDMVHLWVYGPGARPEWHRWDYIIGERALMAKAWQFAVAPAGGQAGA